MLRADPYITLLYIGGTISLVVAVIGLARRPRRGPGVGAFAGMLTSAATWSIAYALELGCDTLGEMLFWIRIEYLGIATCPVFWMLFALAYSGQTQWLKARPVTVFFLMPALTILFVWIDPAGGLIYKHAEVSHDGPFPMLRSQPGPWYFASTAYSYAVVLAGALALWSSSRRAGGLLRSQAGVLIAAAALPTAANVLYRSGLRLTGEMDPTPFAFLLANLAIGRAMSRHGLFNVRPVARSAVFEGMADAVFVFDEGGALIDSNAAARAIAAPSGRGDLHTLLARWPAVIEAAAGITPSRAVSLQAETGSGGSRRIFEVQISRPNPPPGAASFTLVVWRDITERLRREKALRASEDVMASLIRNSPMGIYFYELDAEGQLRLAGWNPAAERLMGVEHASRRGLEITEAFPELKKTGIPERFKSIALSGGTWEAQQVDYDDGRVRGAFEARAFQTTPGKMVVFFYEISARKKAEAALEHARRFERLLIGMSLRFVSLPVELIDTAISDALCEAGRFCEVDRSYLFAADERRQVASNTHEWCAPGIRSVKAELQEVPYSLAPEIIRKLRRGEPCLVPDVDALEPGPVRDLWAREGIKSLLMMPLRREGEFLGFIGFDSVRQRRSWEEPEFGLVRILAGLLTNALDRARMETERLKAEDERREMERRFLHSQKLESLGLLAGGVAHDFNNLLAAISGNLDMAGAALGPDHAARRFLENSRRAVQRAADLTQQMLAYSGKGRLVVGPVDLNALIADNAAILSAAVPKSTRLRFCSAPGLPLITADAGQIQQVIMNLLMNASEALGGAPGEVVIETSAIDASPELLARSRLEEKPPPGRFVRVTVRDTGCGMDEATMERVFEPFFTTKFTGRGLGMAAVLGIVRAHNGALLLESAPGKGTEIQVLFPAETAEAQDGGAAGGAEPGGTAPGGAPQDAARAPEQAAREVWVVDDEEAVRSVCCEALKLAGFDPVPLDGGPALLRLLDTGRRPACVLLDLTMPEMDGPAVLERLAARPAPPPPVLVISGYGQEEAVKRLAGQPVAGFIKKPFTLAALTAKVREVVRA